MSHPITSDLRNGLWDIQVIANYLGAELLDHGKSLLIIALARVLQELPKLLGLSRRWKKWNVCRRGICEFCYVVTILAIIAATRPSGGEPTADLDGQEVFAALSEDAGSPFRRDDVDVLLGQLERALYVRSARAYPDVPGLSVEVHGVMADGRDRDIGHSPQPQKQWEIFDRNSLIGRVTEEARVLDCPDVQQKLEDACRTFRDPPKGYRGIFRSMLCMPVAFAGQVVGGICISSIKDHAFDGREDLLAAAVKDDLEALGFCMQQLRQTDRKQRSLTLSRN